MFEDAIYFQYAAMTTTRVMESLSRQKKKKKKQPFNYIHTDCGHGHP